MFKNIQAVLKAVNLDSGDDHRTAYCQLHIGPLTRDLAVEVSLEMADSLFQVDHKHVFTPRLVMGQANWIAQFPLQKMTFRTHTELVQSEGTIENVDITTLQTMRTKKYPDDFTLVMGIYFQILDWTVAAKLFERLKGSVALTFQPVGQKRLPLNGDGDEKIDRAGKGPLIRIGRK